MTELPEEVARELNDLLKDDMPSYAVTIRQLVAKDKETGAGRTDTWWRVHLRDKIEAGTWARTKRGRAFWYWPVSA